MTVQASTSCSRAVKVRKAECSTHRGNIYLSDIKHHAWRFNHIADSFRSFKLFESLDKLGRLALLRNDITWVQAIWQSSVKSGR